MTVFLPTTALGHDSTMHSVVHTHTLWALNSKVGRWLPVIHAISHADGIEEIRTRQARLRANGKFECRFKLLPIGKEP